jgi:hypothetical protein
MRIKKKMSVPPVAAPAKVPVSREEQLIAQNFYLRSTIVQLQQGQASLMRQNADLVLQVSELNSILMDQDIAPHMQMLVDKGLVVQEQPGQSSAQPQQKVQPIAPEPSVVPVGEIPQE